MKMANSCQRKICKKLTLNQNTENKESPKAKKLVLAKFFIKHNLLKQNSGAVCFKKPTIYKTVENQLLEYKIQETDIFSQSKNSETNSRESES